MVNKKLNRIKLYKDLIPVFSDDLYIYYYRLNSPKSHMRLYRARYYGIQIGNIERVNVNDYMEALLLTLRRRNIDLTLVE